MLPEITLTVTEIIATATALLAIGGWVGFVKSVVRGIKDLKEATTNSFVGVNQKLDTHGSQLSQVVETLARHDVKIKHLEDEHVNSNGQPTAK